MSAKQRSLERLLSNAKIHATFRGGQGDSAGGTLTVQTAKFEQDLTEFHTWDVELTAESGDQSWRVDTMPRLNWARTTPVLTFDQVEIEGIGPVSLRLMFHNCRFAGMWSCEDLHVFIDGVVDQHTHPPHRYVIERTSECMQEWWTGSDWSKDWKPARWFDDEPDGPRLTGDEEAHAVCYASGTVEAG